MENTWTKEKIVNWLKDVLLTIDEENEKGKSEGIEQLNYLLSELSKPETKIID